jgi:hypothetical protein
MCSCCDEKSASKDLIQQENAADFSPGRWRQAYVVQIDVMALTETGDYSS